MPELEFLQANAEVAQGRGLPFAAHLASRIALRDYIRIADEIARSAPGARLLDWGCGFGQMSFLLRRRGLEVVSYDLGRADPEEWLPLTRELTIVVGTDAVKLPFAGAEFDAVLSCGVLEHVPDENGSLAEIRRVLRPEGKLFIYNLPQKYSYKEFLIERLRLGYTHERKYTASSLRTLLDAHGLNVRRVRRSGMLPHMLTGMPQAARAAFNRAAPVVLAADHALSAIPVLSATGESLEVLAVAAQTERPERER